MDILGTSIDDIGGHEALARIEEMTAIGRPADHRPGIVFFANVHSLLLARRDAAFAACLRGADLVLPDGSGLGWGSRLVATPIRENLNGTDFMPRVFERAGARRCSVFLLGARQDVVDRTAEYLRRQYAGLAIAGCQHGYFSEAEEGEVVEAIERAAPDLLLVALGSPRQERWIWERARTLPVGACFAVGGLFDFLSGTRTRAPRWMRVLGLEWVHRFGLNPSDKWRRVLIEIPLFLPLVLIVDGIPLLLRKAGLRR